MSSEATRTKGLPSRELFERASRFAALFEGTTDFRADGEAPLLTLLPSAATFKFGVPFTSVLAFGFVTGVFAAALLAGVVVVLPMLVRADRCCPCEGVAADVLVRELLAGVATAGVLVVDGEPFAAAGIAGLRADCTVESSDLRIFEFCCGVRVEVGVVERAGVVDVLVDETGTDLFVVLG